MTRLRYDNDGRAIFAVHPSKIMLHVRRSCAPRVVCEAFLRFINAL